MRASPAHPPTTPPAMAPLLVDDWDAVPSQEYRSQLFIHSCGRTQDVNLTSRDWIQGLIFCPIRNPVSTGNTCSRVPAGLQAPGEVGARRAQTAEESAVVGLVEVPGLIVCTVRVCHEELLAPCLLRTTGVVLMAVRALGAAVMPVTPGIPTRLLIRTARAVVPECIASGRVVVVVIHVFEGIREGLRAILVVCAEERAGEKGDRQVVRTQSTGRGG